MLILNWFHSRQAEILTLRQVLEYRREVCESLEVMSRFLNQIYMAVDMRIDYMERDEVFLTEELSLCAGSSKHLPMLPNEILDIITLSATPPHLSCDNGLILRSLAPLRYVQRLDVNFTSDYQIQQTLELPNVDLQVFVDSECSKEYLCSFSDEDTWHAELLENIQILSVIPQRIKGAEITTSRPFIHFLPFMRAFARILPHLEDLTVVSNDNIFEDMDDSIDGDGDNMDGDGDNMDGDGDNMDGDGENLHGDGDHVGGDGGIVDGDSARVRTRNIVRNAVLLHAGVGNVKLKTATINYCLLWPFADAGLLSSVTHLILTAPMGSLERCANFLPTLLSGLPVLRILDASGLTCDFISDGQSTTCLGSIATLRIPNLSFLNLCSPSSKIKCLKLRKGDKDDLEAMVSRIATLFPDLRELETVSSLSVNYSKLV